MNERPNKRFEGRTVLITGGGTGMGKAAALRFGREGANVVIAGRRAAELQQVAGAITAAGGIALAVPADVSDPGEVAALVQQAVATFGALHMAWNNAGVLGAFAPLQEMSMDEFDDVVATNLRGVFACLKYEIRAMLEAGAGGAIVNTSSWTAHGAMPGLAAYAGTKAALDAMTRTVALEVGAQNIRINNVSPGSSPRRWPAACWPPGPQRCRSSSTHRWAGSASRRMSPTPWSGCCRMKHVSSPARACWWMAVSRSAGYVRGFGISWRSTSPEPARASRSTQGWRRSGVPGCRFRDASAFNDGFHCLAF